MRIRVLGDAGTAFHWQIGCICLHQHPLLITTGARICWWGIMTHFCSACIAVVCCLLFRSCKVLTTNECWWVFRMKRSANCGVPNPYSTSNDQSNSEISKRKAVKINFQWALDCFQVHQVRVSSWYWDTATNWYEFMNLIWSAVSNRSAPKKRWVNWRHLTGPL